MGLQTRNTFSLPLLRSPFLGNFWDKKILKNKNDAIGQRNHFLCYLRPCIVISKSSIGNLGSNKKNTALQSLMTQRCPPANNDRYSKRRKQYLTLFKRRKVNENFSFTFLHFML